MFCWYKDIVEEWDRVYLLIKHTHYNVVTSKRTNVNKSKYIPKTRINITSFNKYLIATCIGVSVIKGAHE